MSGNKALHMNAELRKDMLKVYFRCQLQADTRLWTESILFFKENEECAEPGSRVELWAGEKGGKNGEFTVIMGQSPGDIVDTNEKCVPRIAKY